MVRIVMKPEERRAEIVQAARSLFQTKDYDEVTMQDVMDALGIAKGTIYYYFKSKEDLLEAVIVDIVDEATAQMKERATASQGNALERLKALITAGQISDQNEEILESLHTPANQAMHLRLLAVAISKQAPLFAEVVQQGCEEGLFHTQSPLECAEFILWGVQSLTDQGIYPWSEADLKRRAAAFPALLEAILQAPAGSFHFLSDIPMGQE
jgi:AcrR family transcriptional regulator